MSARPWMKFFVGDYLADTTHLTTVQHGAYLLLIMHYWRHEGLPSDSEMLARITGLTRAEWRKCEPIIREFFEKNWRHPRIDRDISEAFQSYQRRAKAGRRGGKAASNAQAMLKPSESEPDTAPLGGSRGQGEGGSNVSRLAQAHGQARPRLAVVNGSRAEPPIGFDGDGVLISFDTAEVPF